MAEVTTTTTIPDDLGSLSHGARALIGAALEVELIAAAQERRREAARQSGGSFAKTGRQSEAEAKARKSAVIAAQQVGVGHESIRVASRLLQQSPDLAELVRSGDLTLSEASAENDRRRRLHIEQVRAEAKQAVIDIAALARLITVSPDMLLLVHRMWPPPPELPHPPPAVTADMTMPTEMRRALILYEAADKAVIAAADHFAFAVPHYGPEWSYHIAKGDAAAAAAVAGTLNERHALWRAEAVKARRAADRAVIQARAPETRTALQKAADGRLEALDQHLCDVAASTADYHADRQQLAVDRDRAEALRRDLDRAVRLKEWADTVAGVRQELLPPAGPVGPVGPTVWPVHQLSRQASAGLSRLWGPVPVTRREP